ncbi:glucose-1-phosphate adenylyltransferase [Azohydromonas australica]|uniref:glucose-1-phosphate adenylyltransferase n=1 Tax=Azohydromonas australica TaxID=364039 RepID=UPI00048C5431|nr:glucose-1-phosphate adenylyltransferase [Azohydromonas australica]
MTSNEFALSLELPRRTVALVLAGGRGSRLMNLTDHRAKPAVYFGGKFRIVDFALSNCLNSGIRRIGVITQYKSHSLLRHLQRGWAFLKAEMNEFVDLLPAQQRIDEENWYRGTADAVYQNEDIVRSYRAKYVLVLAGDHVYKMDYSLMLADHVASGAECTVGCIEVPREEASGFGVMAVDASGRITDFVEKPLQPPPIPGHTDVSLASMGIYVFNADYLFRELARDVADEDSDHDFGRDILPRAVQQGVARAHHFGRSCVGHGRAPYWRDVGTVDAYWDANIDLTATEPQLDLYDQRWPILTYQPQRPPARFVGAGSATESLVSGGCIVAGRVQQSLVFSSVRIDSNVQLNHSVLLPYVELGRNARVSRAVVDRGCIIPDGTVIGEDPVSDARRFHRTERGIVLVTRKMLAQV